MEAVSTEPIYANFGGRLYFCETYVVAATQYLVAVTSMQPTKLTGGIGWVNMAADQINIAIVLTGGRHIT